MKLIFEPTLMVVSAEAAGAEKCPLSELPDAFFFR